MTDGKAISKAVRSGGIVPASTFQRVAAGVGLLAATAGATLVARFDPTTAGFFPVCPLFKFTGILCPGCGLTRGFHALFHGDVLGALHYNALLPIFAAFFAFAFVSLLLFAGRGRGLSWRFVTPAALYGLAILAATFFVLRNLPFHPFTLLAPQ